MADLNFDKNCIFCKIIAREVPSAIIAETNNIIVIKDLFPKAPIHYLIIPKKHVQDIQSLHENDTALAGELILMAKQLSTQLNGSKAFRLLVNSGADVGQKVFHLHLHFLAGKQLTDF